jgi:hypothetical protein
VCVCVCTCLVGCWYMWPCVYVCARTAVCARTSVGVCADMQRFVDVQVTDDGMAELASMSSLMSLNVVGCHRLTPRGKASVAHLLDPLIL